MISFSGDDLGTVWYAFTGGSVAEAMNYVIDHKPDGYNIVDISISKKYWFWGQYIIDVILENPEKINKLKGTQHYSKQWNDTNKKLF